MKHIFLVRHGQSEANVIQTASKDGDDSLYNEATINFPDRSWRLTPDGVAQAKTTGDYLRALEVEDCDLRVSPYARTRETAAHLNLSGLWQEDRSIRERYWGEIGSMPRKQFKAEYPTNAYLKKADPLYWTPPSGESIAAMAETRVRNFLKNFQKSDRNMIAVTHGDFIWATRLVMEGWSDEEFFVNDTDPAHKIHNCIVIHYSFPDASDPGRGTVQMSYPIIDGKGGWMMSEGKPRDFSYTTLLDSAALLALAEASSRHF